ncbi:hypothetical protein HMPREF9186_00175 [Streptococcus sp. F0442]|uniref:YpmS family protein n=1 Tax=Streptococcus sp. F0442 TaxID=999425 RepID=UPI0002992CE4|nr:YpmS family protein [Streptococcus sp. F0442]EKS21351.1 hypothetical protein HMPREF9186_00175 [Streptococcus sp. F0442]
MPRRKLGVKNNPIKEKITFLQKINIWKWLFLGLVSLLLAVVIVVQGRLASPREDVSQLHQTVRSKDVKVGTMTTTRDQLNDTIQSLLKKYKLSDYKVYADNQQVLLEGQLSLLGKDYPLYMYFQPSKLENGNILLTVKDFSVGSFQIPQKMVLRLLSKNKNIPDFIQISPKESTITIVLPEIDNDFGLYAKANTIDLYNDKIVFDLYQKK